MGFMNSCYTTGLFLYPQKTLENHSFFDVFRRYRQRPATWNELIKVTSCEKKNDKIMPAKILENIECDSIVAVW